MASKKKPAGKSGKMVKKVKKATGGAKFPGARVQAGSLKQIVKKANDNA